MVRKKDIEKKSSEGNQDLVESFKKVVIDMHRGIPSYFYFGYLDKLIPTDEMRDYMLEKDVFVKSKKTKNQHGQEGYFLGFNGMILANNYINQELQKNNVRLQRYNVRLTKQMKTLTSWIIYLTIGMICLTIVMIWFSSIYKV